MQRDFELNNSLNTSLFQCRGQAVLSLLPWRASDDRVATHLRAFFAYIAEWLLHHFQGMEHEGVRLAVWATVKQCNNILL